MFPALKVLIEKTGPVCQKSYHKMLKKSKSGFSCQMSICPSNWSANGVSVINKSATIEAYLVRLSSSRSKQNIGCRVVSIWHGR